MTHEYSRQTESILVRVMPVYLPKMSSPEKSHYAWAYFITLENKGQETIQLVSRYWHITDGHGRVQEVRGEGVVGLQPVLKPGDAFKYNSGTHLDTPCGIMQGTYTMKRQDGSLFDISIPAFSLDSAEQLRRPN